MEERLEIEEKDPVRVVVVGGGVGGTLVANLLARRLAGRAAIELVTASPWHVYEPALLYVPFDDLPQVDVQRPERDLLRPEVALVDTPAVRIDTAGRRLLMRSGLELRYDYLVLATGSELAPEALPGFAEGAHHFATVAAAERLHDAMFRFTGGRIVIGAAQLPHKHPQAMLEFAFLLADHCERNGLAGRTEIVFATPAERPFHELELARIAEQRFDERGIRFVPHVKPAAIRADQRLLVAQGGVEIPYDLLVMAPPERGVALVRDSNLGDGEGWLPTDPETLRLRGARDVWVLGDCSDLVVARAPSAASRQARVVAEAIAADFLGKRPRSSLAAYDGTVEMFVEMGDGQAAFVDADYERAAAVQEPSRAIAAGKRAFDRAYWQLVPTGLV